VEGVWLVKRPTQVENPEEGVPQVFAKIPWGVRAFWENCQGAPYF